ncbi:MAG TPA: VOC family protein [Fimbriimonadaceae bacterium]|nr:VOC family protein [Fimbriimonadaceae bacterium]
MLTGDVKVVIYVSDVLESVRYYSGVLGFDLLHYFDRSTGESVDEWTKSEPPIYAEMSAGGRKFGLHMPVNEADRRSVGATKVYFRVRDLAGCRGQIERDGGSPGEAIERPWMDMFEVTDPDGNRIVFATSGDGSWIVES